jgi:hypothetical protein
MNTLLTEATAEPRAAGTAALALQPIVNPSTPSSLRPAPPPTSNSVSSPCRPNASKPPKPTS